MSDWFTPAAVRQQQTPSADSIVDQRPLQNARKPASLAASTEEQSLAQEALQAGDQEVDLAFASARRDAVEHPPAPTAEMRKIDEQIKAAQARVQAGEGRIAELNKQIAGATCSRKNDLQQQLELAQAQLHLDENGLKKAQENLVRAGGDQPRVIQHVGRAQGGASSGCAGHPRNRHNYCNRISVPGTPA